MVREDRLRTSELRELIRTSEIYKISLGRSATLRAEALRDSALVFASEKFLYAAVMSGDDAKIARAGKAVRVPEYPSGNAPDKTISKWRGSIETFRSLPVGTLVLHWDSAQDRLLWGISGATYVANREEPNQFGQSAFIFHRKLLHGWDSNSLGGIRLSSIHPKAREIAINMATISRVKSNPDYFRALISDGDTSKWEGKPDWVSKAKEKGWKPKDKKSLLASRRKAIVTPDIEETVAYVFDEIAEIARMAATATHTAAYANGQTVLMTVKRKDISFTRAELEDEIARLLKEQHYCCALTGYDFRKNLKNPHLKMSLDRKNSSKGYVENNLQVVTRAANFYKSASDETDWAHKASALEHMAIAIQRRRKAASPPP